jgi:hypothetical protein
MVPWIMTANGEEGRAAEKYSQDVPSVACFTCAVDRAACLHIARQCLSCALLRGHEVLLRQYYCTLALSAGNDVCDGACFLYSCWMH